MPANQIQDATFYLPKNKSTHVPLLTSTQRHQKTQQYLQRYFFPWSVQNKQMIYYILSTNKKDSLIKNIMDVELEFSHICEKLSCYGTDYKAIHRVPKVIIANMNLRYMPNVHCSGKNRACNGIMVKNAVVRALPTTQSFYANPFSPGEGYPFDYLQDGDLWLGAPVKIVQRTLDHQWLLVHGQGILGWVPRLSVAHAGDQFRQQFERTKQFVTPIQRRSTFYFAHPKSGRHGLRLYLGSLYPVIKQHKMITSIAIPMADKNREAVIKPFSVMNKQFLPWPISTTPAHFAFLINQLLHMPYGWGGLDFDSDCSGTLTRLFTAFGIWIVPSALVQGQYGGKIYAIPLGKRKQWLLENKGKVPLVPYLTLITLGHVPHNISHVMLYLGAHKIDGKMRAIVFQAAWGLHISPIKQGDKSIGRVIYGRSVISSVSEGENLLAAFHQAGLTLGSRWKYPVFNVTLLTGKPAPLEDIKSL